MMDGKTWLTLLLVLTRMLEGETMWMMDSSKMMKVKVIIKLANCLVHELRREMP